MKVLVVSDIHGSVKYTKKLIEAFHQEEADQILLLGDVLYHGPRNALPEEYNPLEVAELLQEYIDCIWAVRGNCDSEVDEMVLGFDLSADYRLFHIDGMDVIASHGHIYHPDHLPKHRGGVLFLFGHIHIPLAEKREGNYIGNPGSVSLPKGKTNSYGILENKMWIVKDFEGNILDSIKIDFESLF